jgi:hypothetical protein
MRRSRRSSGCAADQRRGDGEGIGRANRSEARGDRPGAPPPPPPPPAPWERITAQDIAGLDYRVPPDGGVVSPMAAEDDLPEDQTKDEVENVREGLIDWPMGRHSKCALPSLRGGGAGRDPDAGRATCRAADRHSDSQCALPASVRRGGAGCDPDAGGALSAARSGLQPPDRQISEGFLVALETDAKILTWIVLHPDRDGATVDSISDAWISGVVGAAGDPSIVRERSYLYAIKFIGRLTGRFEP